MPEPHTTSSRTRARILAERCEPVGLCLFEFRGVTHPVQPISGTSASLEILNALNSIPNAPLRIAKALEAGREVELWPGLWMFPVGFASESGDDGFVIAITRMDSSDLATQVKDPYFAAASPGQRARRVATAIRRWDRDLASLDEARASVESMGFQLSEAYEELSLLYKVGQRMSINEPPQELLLTVCTDIRSVLGFTWCALLIEGGVIPPFERQAPSLIVDGTPPLPFESLFHRLLEARAQVRDERTFICEDLSTAQRPELEGLAKSILIQPLRIDGRIGGLFIAADKRVAESQLTTIDLKLISASLSQLEVFLNNGFLYNRLHRMFIGTLEALTAAIDAKDAYTCGHSVRVAMIGRMIAQEIGLEPKTIERVHVAGLIHDVGKIGVPEAVLCKPGRLTDAEFAFIRKHPEIGARIIRGVPHFDDVIPGVLHHHERYDGKGYPHGLAGLEIPTLGRILAVADSFDAMSSTRAYRPALPRDRVLAEIQQCAGTQFDPQLAAAFLRIDLAPYDEMLAKHRAQYPDPKQEAA